jgi:hypothetical protein
MVEYGTDNFESANHIWSRIFEALSIGSKDDIWAQFLGKEFEIWKEPHHEWRPTQFEASLRDFQFKSVNKELPAFRFVRDLEKVIDLKDFLTRRQWVSLLESTLRIGSASHVLWLCRANMVLWDFFVGCIEGKDMPSIEDLSCTLFSVESGYWRYGEKVMPAIKQWARNYITGRVGVNFILTLCDHLAAKGEFDLKKIELNSLKNIHELGLAIKGSNGKFVSENVRDTLGVILDKEPRLLACSKGTTSNIVEFLRYSLGQRQTADPEARNYDQGYWVKKAGSHSAAPWVIAAGPVSLMAIAHCCAKGSSSPRTIEDFCRHLGDYGVAIRTGEIVESGLGRSLRNLGLVTDSPDAEGGMVVTDPFAIISKRQ